MQWFATHKKQNPDGQGGGGQNAEKIKKRAKSVNTIK
jgi:hypothetical protein